MKELKVALFDLDGTLIDTEGQYSKFWGMIGREYHPELPDFASMIKGTTLVDIHARYFPDESVQQKLDVRISEWEKSMEYEFMPGACNFVKDLKDHGVKCGIVTSSNQEKMGNVLRRLPELNEMFDLILTSEGFKRSKPSPDCYLEGARLLNADITECVVFEDAINGLDSGMNAKMFTIGLSTTYPHEEVAKHCNMVVPDFHQISYNMILEAIQD